MLGRQYDPEFLANPRNHRTRSSILFQGPRGNLLVDCSPEMRLQLTREGILDVNDVIITHTHADHVMGMDDLRSISMHFHRDVRVTTLPQHQADIRRIYPYAFQPAAPGIFVPRFDLQDMQPEMTLAGLPVRLFVVKHGPTDVIGVRVGDFAYITDVSEIPDDVRPVLEGLDTVMLDSTRFAPHVNHFHFDAAMAEAERIGARLTVLTHLSHDYDHDAFEAGLPANVRLAYDGMRLPVVGIRGVTTDTPLQNRLGCQ